ERRLLVVPADLNPLVGSADVATPAGSACGALSLRCGFEVWLEAGDFDLEMRTGFLEPALLDRARRKRAEIAGGDPIGSARERETDAEPEYQDVAKVLTEARTALLDSRPRRVEQPGKVLPFRPPTRWGSLGSPYAIAASVLLAVTLGLSGGMVWQSQELGKVVHELGVREQAHRQELAERAQERQRREQTHRRVIAGLTEEGE
ncbi:MAG: hypothetical protein GY856_52040, partial [bacterium]|nr:hypothetical protein [bacterium]